LYREGNHEYTFPIYEEDGTWVLVGRLPRSGSIFSSVGIRVIVSFRGREERIVPRIAEHFRMSGARVRVFEQDCGDFQFHPELFEHRSRAAELLETAGYTWFSDFSSIEPVHEEYGLEICGILNERDVGPIAERSNAVFPTGITR